MKTTTATSTHILRHIDSKEEFGDDMRWENGERVFMIDWNFSYEYTEAGAFDLFEPYSEMMTQAFIDAELTDSVSGDGGTSLFIFDVDDADEVKALYREMKKKITAARAGEIKAAKKAAKQSKKRGSALSQSRA